MKKTLIQSYDERKLNLLMDLYQLTMSQGYFNHTDIEKEVVFDMFFRKTPDGGSFAIMAGVEQVVDYIKNFHFEKEEIDILRSKNLFSEEFLEYLSNLRFTGDIYAIPEGTPVFPMEPLITVKTKIIEAQLIETMILNQINHQTLIATKANRIVRCAEGVPVMEFGARRGQGADSAIYGGRACHIAGCVGTATVLLEEMGINAMGTHAHSWVQFFDEEYDAFLAYAKTYPNNCILLVDTYNVLKSGIPNAIRVAKEYLEPNGYRLKGVRLDSGDLASLSIAARKMFDEAGMQDCKICLSNSLDEYSIPDIFSQIKEVYPNVKDVIMSLGVGERMICSATTPVFGGVYKLAAVQDKNGVFQPRIKLSENEIKVTNPGFKKVWRLYNKDTGKAICDVLTLAHETIDESIPFIIKDGLYEKEITNFKAVPLQRTYIKDGKVNCLLPTLKEIQERVVEQLDTFWDEYKRINKPQRYYINLSDELTNLKQELLKKGLKQL